MPISFSPDLAVIAQEPCRCAVSREGHGQGCFFLAIGEKAPVGDAVDPKKCPVGAVLRDMVFGHFPMNGLSFRVELSADKIDANLAILQFMKDGDRVCNYTDLFIFYKRAEVKNGATAVKEDDVAVVNAGGGTAGDGFFCLDVDRGFVGERKGLVGKGDFYGAAAGTKKEAVGG